MGIGPRINAIWAECENAVVRGAQVYRPAKLVLGIDPGLRGAVALLEVSRRGRPQLVQVDDMPLHHPDGRQASRRVVDPVALSQLVRVATWDTAVVEAVGPAPGQGVASMFSLGRSLGLVEGALAGLDGREVVMVAPGVWKGSLRLAGGVANKRRSVELACRLWPAMANQLTNDGRAEAALIAAWWVMSRR